ncbi:hypothetical protein JI664_12930 [Rhodobacter sp. NTK016B]|uniref:hypothetical protein n=1 Tax=Rhodobacter sp. NTK016B TaxID=2759676 RepID=UPI001A9034D5|nr:hypothetical protein [Rhodobacter sp. NTK016B]MBN8292871.1 hypothetical protein [Rhodobacter sp. NTK016B]
MKHPAVPIIVAALWIVISEFVRNEFLLKSYWERHYSDMGLAFPDAALNGATWALWSLCLSVLLWMLLKRFALIEGIGVAWFAGFLMMWVVTGNLGVLPFALLLYAVPLSLLEVAGAALIQHFWPRER